MIKLIGILVVAVGFALRANTLLVVLVAGVVTGLVSGMSWHEIVAQFGTYFVENRYMTLPVILMLPLVGMLERHGLRERAETLIRRARAATAGRVLLLYSVMRQISISLGVRIGDHASAVRPIVAPMAEAAAARLLADASGRAGGGAGPARELPVKVVHDIRAHAAAAENVGNFFGEDVFIAVGAVLLMSGFFQSVGMQVSVWALALWGIPTAIVAFLLMWWRARVLDRRIAAALARTPPAGGAVPAAGETAKGKPEEGRT
ncbi:DUF969 family protein [Opitutus sp. ER46]|uniref:5-oxoproline transporter, DUF969 family subunit n=1 Tax=Opitutus sp. ER46 TaxID=2161864 RepID=UPI000D2FE57C|nr:DUF969 family protein [Opitutus sp. ER46]PTX94518.1 DUF969 domain-containing protein [Opitutus sp. ER46]